MPAQTFTVSGTWTCPADVTEVQVECWAGGGSGGAFLPGTPDDPLTKGDESTPSISGLGGGGGAYAKGNAVVVVPTTVYTVTVGSSAQDSWFNTTGTVKAAAGQNGATGAVGAGGLAANCVGDVKTAGSNGSGTTGGNAGNGGAGGAVNVAGGFPGGGGGGDSASAAPGAGTGGLGQVILTWTAPGGSSPSSVPARNQLIVIG